MPDGVSSSPDPAVCSHTASQSAHESSAFRQSQDTALDTPNGEIPESLLLAYFATLNTARYRGYWRQHRYAVTAGHAPLSVADTPLYRRYAQASFCGMMALGEAGVSPAA